MSTANKWNVLAKGGRNTMAGALTGKLKCWNCEKEGCTVSKCDQPKNQAKIDKNKKAFMENKKKKSEDKTKSNPGTNGGSGGGDYQRKKWSAGMLEQNGVLMVNCKVCGPNLTHTTGFHKEWNRNRANFTLPDTHPCVKAKALVAGTQPPPTCTPAPAPATAPAPAPLANPDILTFSR